MPCASVLLRHRRAYVRIRFGGAPALFPAAGTDASAHRPLRAQLCSDLAAGTLGHVRHAVVDGPASKAACARD
eukprot:3092488-Pyramimonas_sp.AAC.1